MDSDNTTIDQWGNRNSVEIQRMRWDSADAVKQVKDQANLYPHLCQFHLKNINI